MSQDLEQYQRIIEQLKPMIREPEFNQLLEQVAAHVPKPKRFLIKMELKRLARPCSRLIDLREQVEAECREYEHQGQIHYLDEQAIDIFEQQLRQFGNYTLGVYEAVMSSEHNLRVQYHKNRKAPQVKTTNEPAASNKDYQAELVRFGRFARRSEERMNYSMNVELFTEQRKSSQATTVDVSVSGVKLKISSEQLFKPGERLTLQFRSLEGEFSLDKKNGIAYQVVNVERNRQDQRISLKRLDDIPAPAFDAFIERFIHGNKRRYKVNMDNTIEAIRNKSFEQYYTPNFSSLPVFIEHIDDKYQAKYALINNANRDPLHYWSDEQGQLRLGYVFSHERICALLALPPERRATFVYCFNHVKDDNVYFYSASQQELAQDEGLRTLFLGYGARKASWRMYKLQLTEIEPNQAYLPLSLPDSVNQNVKRQNQPPAPRLMARLKHLKQVALLTDITDVQSTERYQKLRIQRDKLAELRRFAHPRNRTPASIDIFRFKFSNQRRETRFQLRTQVLVRVHDQVFTANSEDISVRGLKIEVPGIFADEPGTKVSLSFPKLQKVTRKYQLSDLPYRVRSLSLDRNVLHLQAIHTESNTTAQRFFDELIRNNKSRLKAFSDEESIPGMGIALRNIYARNNLNVGFFFKKEGIEFLPEAAATAQQKSRLVNLLSHEAEPDHFNLGFLYKAHAHTPNFIANNLRHLKASQRPLMAEMFIAFQPEKSDYHNAIQCHFVDAFDSPQSRRKFIIKATEQGQFIALRLFLTRTGRPDIEALQAEINYVGVYAVHRSKQLEEQLWSIWGVGELVDVTDDAMQRYLCTEQQIEKNRQLPRLQEVQGVEHLLKHNGTN